MTAAMEAEEAAMAVATSPKDADADADAASTQMSQCIIATEVEEPYGENGFESALRKEQWYHGTMSREEADYQLLTYAVLFGEGGREGHDSRVYPDTLAASSPCVDDQSQ